MTGFKVVLQKKTILVLHGEGGGLSPGLQLNRVTDMQSSVTMHRLLILVTLLPDNLQQHKCVVKSSHIIITY